MRIKGMIVGTVLAVGLAGAAPVLAASIGGTDVTVKRHVDVLHGQDQHVYVEVAIDRDEGPLQGHPRISVEHFDHRGQAEDPDDLGYGWDHVTAPWIGTQGVDHYDVANGTPCWSCGPIDTVCALLGDRC